MAVEGPLEFERLKSALQQLCDRHETLRTGFELRDGEPVQIVRDTAELNVSLLECTEEELPRMMEELVQPFELAKAPLFRAAVIRIDEERYVLFIDMHHIISDGVSMGVLVDEVTRLYAGERLEPLRVQYRDYAVWQQTYNGSETFRKHEMYWLERLSGELPVLELPTDYLRPAVKQFEGSRYRYTLSPELTSRIQQFNQEHGATLFMTLFSIYNLLLAKYSGNEDLIVGTPVAGRNHPDMERVVGMFVNTLAIRTQVSPSMTFTKLLEQVKRHVLDAFEHQDYPFDDLVEKLGVSRDTSRTPLFDTMFAVQNMEMPEMQTERLSFRPYTVESDTAKFDLTFEVFSGNDRIHLDIEYSTALFTEQTVARMLRHFEQAIESVISEPSRLFSEIEIRTAEDIAAAKRLVQAADTEEEVEAVPVNRGSISWIFEEQVKLHPNRTALVFEDESWSYSELNAMANRMAHVLKARLQHAKQPRVALRVDRSPEMIVSILATLKAGAAYIPLDPSYPDERVSSILQDSEAAVLLTSAMDRDAGFQLVDVIDIADPELYAAATDDLPEVTALDDIAYIMYTSGTTGKPKGILTTHRNVIRVVNNTNYIEITEEDALLQLSNYAFDGSVFDIFGSLLNGAKLVLVSRQAMQDVARLTQLIREEQISVMFLTTALFNTLIDLEPYCFCGVRKVLFGGEKVSIQHVRKAMSVLGSGKMLHVYGPTETTVFATYYPIGAVDDKSYTIPIGKPINQTSLYILNSHLQPQPIGVWGELYIGGDGVSLGYLNREELTREKFVRLPGLNSVTYRTGDRVRLLPDGHIEYGERLDGQVKLRGFRIELGEIESAIRNLPEVREAAVITRLLNGTMAIAAFLVLETRGQSQPSADSIRRHLYGRLPEYMLPSAFVFLEQLPLTANGKINRRMLEGYPLHEVSSKAFVAPATGMERKLALLWADILQVEQVSAKDHFFELGGNSLRAMMLSGRVTQQLNIKMTLNDVFQHPILHDLANCLETRDSTVFSAIEKAEEREWYPVSPVQRRMYFLQQLEEAGTSYNMPALFTVVGALDPVRVQDALDQLLQRHETLRTEFAMIEGEIVQRIHQNMKTEVQWIRGEGQDVKLLVSSLIRPFDLSQPPLIRLSVIPIHAEKHLFVFDMHHIAADGMAMDVLMSDFAAFYRREALPGLELDYKDYAVWQNRLLAEGGSQSLEQYWLDVFAGELPVLNLPTDYRRPVTQTFDGSRERFVISKPLAEKIKSFSKQMEATPFMTLLGAFSMLLAKYSGQTDIIIGTPVSGRRYAGLEHLIGLFVNTLALRTYPEAGKTAADYIQEVKRHALEAFAHQDYPFEELVDRLQLRRDLSRNPLFDVMFSYHELEEQQLRMDDLTVQAMEFETNVSKFDLTLDVTETADGWIAEFEYNTQLFKAETIRILSEHFHTLLQSLTDQPQAEIGRLNMVPEREREWLLRTLKENETAYERERSIDQLFEEQARQTPDAVAIRCGTNALTYRQLNEAANRLANVLRRNGAEKGAIIGLHLERSTNLMVGLLAVLKAGAAYVPIDPSFPLERIQFMLEDAAVTVLLADHDQVEGLNYIGQTMNVSNPALYAEESPANLAVPIDAKDLAYVIYTSGSTGRPKGVMISHQAVHNFMCGMREHIPFEAGRSILCLTTVSFDIFVTETLLPLCSGMEVVMCDELERREVTRLLDLIEKQRVSMLQATPSTVEFILSHPEATAKLGSIREIMVGGEELPLTLLNKLRSTVTSAEIFNVYGPTEFTVWCTIGNVTDAARVTIGRPLQNTAILIVDANHELQPLGVPGELCIAGDGMSKGYWNRDELTAEKFVSIPFLPGKMMYKSGDLARWLPDGSLEYYGRMDFQVKIRGYRIELGEIEELIRSTPGVKEAVVTAKKDSQGQSYLCAYVVSDIEHSYAQWKLILSERLPEYMIPNYVMYLDKLPLTPNNKVDRKALPDPDTASHRESNYVAPETDTENTLCHIWEKLLGVPRVGVLDRFFELGGHSLKAVALVGEIMKQCSVELPLRFVFQQETVREQAAMIDRIRAGYLLDQPVTVLQSKEKAESIFFFPPLAGYGVVYEPLAEQLPDCNVYGFDFIPEEDRLQRYVEMIEAKHNESDPLILAGYSVGGNLAFEVAKALEQRGHRVSHLVLIDAYRKTESLSQSEEEALAEVRDVLDDGGMYQDVLANPAIRNQVENTMLGYKKYYNALQNEGAVSAEVHLIRSEEFADHPLSWNEVTEGECREYQALGSHESMMTNPMHRQATALMLRGILDAIWNRTDEPVVTT
ncbi:non-ribosomal peptide synthetase [Paenibacillus turpanensis]|uniref:non-ribosomal peptide synthetase n=1 Tax=Paenibacillus turpanensis TaxID=2689078 RepID=UPI001FB65496|nr:non-ribosomal peptide synthetase [Paenibacillus turpanensis]